MQSWPELSSAIAIIFPDPRYGALTNWAFPYTPTGQRFAWYVLYGQPSIEPEACVGGLVVPAHGASPGKGTGS